MKLFVPGRLKGVLIKTHCLYMMLNRQLHKHDLINNIRGKENILFNVSGLLTDHVLALH